MTPTTISDDTFLALASRVRVLVGNSSRMHSSPFRSKALGSWVLSIPEVERTLLFLGVTVPRSNFTDTIPSTVAGFRLDGSPNGGPFTVSDGRYASETSSGTQRRKPKGWMPPTGYSFSHVTYQRAMGSVRKTLVDAPWEGNETRGCIGESGVGLLTP